jgi:hypothetical protein
MARVSVTDWTDESSCRSDKSRKPTPVLDSAQPVPGVAHQCDGVDRRDVGGIVECEELVGAASADQDVEVGSIVPLGSQHPVGMRGNVTRVIRHVRGGFYILVM